MSDESGLLCCELCGEPMPENEAMFKIHGFTGPCPAPPLPRPAEINWQTSYERAFARIAELEDALADESTAYSIAAFALDENDEALNAALRDKSAGMQRGRIKRLAAERDAAIRRAEAAITALASIATHEDVDADECPGIAKRALLKLAPVAKEGER